MIDLTGGAKQRYGDRAEHNGASGGVAMLSGGRDAAAAGQKPCASRSGGANPCAGGRAAQGRTALRAGAARGWPAILPPRVFRLTAEWPYGSGTQAGGCRLLRAREIDLGCARMSVRLGAIASGRSCSTGHLSRNGYDGREPGGRQAAIAESEVRGVFELFGRRRRGVPALRGFALFNGREEWAEPMGRQLKRAAGYASSSGR